MIFLLTDFGSAGPYVGQVIAAIARRAPDARVIPLFNDLPAFRPDLAAYLLPAYSINQSEGAVFLCVVDPGVGGERRAVAVEADGRWYVGPDNGLFSIVARRADNSIWWDIGGAATPDFATFHGRDLFAPVAASLALGLPPDGECVEPSALGAEGPDDLFRIVYVDHYGNLMTGIRASALGVGDQLALSGHTFVHARTFSDVPAGSGFWYENANGLVEIAVNSGSARDLCHAEPGDHVRLIDGGALLRNE